jgi:hypothetical protein
MYQQNSKLENTIPEDKFHNRHHNEDNKENIEQVKVLNESD